MPNHVHLIALPQREDSLAILLRRVHGRYAQYYNARDGRAGHLWQNRFFACILGPQHLWAALAYVDRNPVRAGMVTSAGEYPWSSAAAHLSGVDPSRLVDMDWWRQQEFRGDWAAELTREAPECATQLRKCTYAGRPFGNDDLVEEVGRRFGRSWTRGRPKKEAGAATAYDRDAQFPLFM
jgi:putative transposase